MTYNTKRKTKAYRVRTYIYNNPDASAAQVSKATKVDITYVYNIMGTERKRIVDQVATFEGANKRLGTEPKVEAQSNEEPVKLTLWQRVKLWFAGFGGAL